MMNCPYTRTRRDADMALTSYRNEASPPLLEAGIKNFLNCLKDGHMQYMVDGDLADLVRFALRNTSVVGYLMHKVFNIELKSTATRQEGNRYPKDCTLYVSIKVDNVNSTKQTFSSNSRTVIDSTRDGTTKIGSEWTGYGANLDVVIAMEFRPRDMVANDPRVLKLEYEQHVVIAPDRDRRHAYSPARSRRRRRRSLTSAPSSTCCTTTSSSPTPSCAKW